VNARVLFATIIGLVMTSVLLVFYFTRPEPKSPVPAAPVERPAPPPSPPVVERKPETPPSEPARPVNRRPAPKPGGANIAPPPAPESVAAAPKTATLRINSDVPGAQVFIDRVFIGAAPVTAPNVAPGTHRLNVSAPGYDGVAETVEVTAGPRDILIKLKEVRLDASLAVVHKHRMGSCRGQLIATPQGIRYETTDKSDAFNVPLRDLETFQVEYLEKNLRVKLQKGKRYDFTDPDGNADRLFVFHRDVEKARERLRKGDPPAF
jgi:PEGA domain-containing protein